MSPLIAAALYEHSTIIEILLQYNADTATTNNQYGENALHLATRFNETTTTTVQLLLNNMKLEDINHKTTDGNTPLDRCYEYNDSSIKQQLIDLIRQKGGKRKRELQNIRYTHTTYTTYLSHTHNTNDYPHTQYKYNNT